ncbi:MAG: hypothetical protein GQ570_03555 [Helicobacteraceae bacterium]|nr:hypothetical protein [Helicobacteraceae bacterium]
MAVIKRTIKSKTKKFTAKEVKLISNFMKLTDKQLEEKLPDATRYKVGQTLSDSDRHARLVLMHRLLLRRVPMRVIADELGISERMGYNLKAQLREYAISEMNETRWEGYIADTIMFYEEMKASALLIASAGSSNQSNKIQALLAALTSEKHKQDFMTRLGVLGDPQGMQIAQKLYLPAHDQEIEHDQVAIDTLSMISAELKTISPSNDPIEAEG